MNYTRNHVVAGGRGGDPSLVSVTMDPVKLEQDMEIAVKSIAYGEIHNISSANNCFYINPVIGWNILGPATMERITSGALSAGTLDDLLSSDERSRSRRIAKEGISYETDRVGLFIKPGRYSSAFEILEAMGHEVDRFIEGNALGDERCAVTKVGTETYLKIPDILEFIPNLKGGPIEVLKCEVAKTIVRTTIEAIPSHTEMCFLYLNIVQNSFINGRKSRIACVFPIKSDDGYTFFEFKTPTYIPIEIRQFSNITISLLDITGHTVGINPQYDTVVTLHMRHRTD